jgi:hypothetical protein
MSWKATAWAERQKTGSPARKVLLLVLANYANEDGICWPSQQKLSKGCEQSVDTVQRNLRRLAADGFVTSESRPRAGGRWPSLIYRLAIPPEELADTEPQDAVRQERNSVDKGAHMRHGRAATRTPHRAAPSPPPCRTAMRHEPSNNLQREPSLEPPVPQLAAAQAAASAGIRDQGHWELVLARRLGVTLEDLAELPSNDLVHLCKRVKSGDFNAADESEARAALGRWGRPQSSTVSQPGTGPAPSHPTSQN